MHMSSYAMITLQLSLQLSIMAVVVRFLVISNFPLSVFQPNENLSDPNHRNSQYCLLLKLGFRFLMWVPISCFRDLYVWKTMEDHPVLWSVLRAASASMISFRLFTRGLTGRGMDGVGGGGGGGDLCVCVCVCVCV